MADGRNVLPAGCMHPTLMDIYDVMIDIERRMHAVRILIGKLDPKIRLDFAENGVAEGWDPERTEVLARRVVCGVCHPVPKWPPFEE